MIEGVDPFTTDPSEARRRFLAACDRVGLPVESFPATNRSCKGLYADVAHAGSPDAPTVLVLCSSASGTSGLAAAGISCGVIASRLHAELPRTVGLVIVQAVNPEGPVWSPLTPEERGRVEDEPSWTDSLLSAAEARFNAYKRTAAFDRDRLAAHTLLSATDPAWAPSTRVRIADNHLRKGKRFLFVDVRTGPGDFAEMELFSPDARNGRGSERLTGWIGRRTVQPVTAAHEGPVSPLAGGLPSTVFDRSQETLVVEFGTYMMPSLLEGLGEVKTVSPAFPDNGEWREAVWNRMSDLLLNAMQNLGG